MQTVKNTQPGPRGIQTKSGLVMIEPGQTVGGLDVAEGDLKVAKASGYFEFGGKADKAEDDGLGGLKFDDLKAVAVEHKIDVPVGMSKAKLLEAIRAVRLGPA